MSTSDIPFRSSGSESNTPQRYMEMLRDLNKMRSQQIKVLGMSYAANFLILFGYSVEYVIAVYYSHGDK